MGGARRHPRSRADGSRAQGQSERTLDPRRRAFELRFARVVRDIAATAELLAVTADHLSHEAEAEAEPRAERLRCRAEVERREARRLWALADDLEA